jgi:hypothetical protein
MQQEPVACRFCYSEKGCWTWQCYNCGEIDDVQKPTPPAAKPPAEWELIKNILAEYGLQAISFVAEWKAAQREWVGLTDDDMKDPKTHILDFIYGARWAEAKLKERNHD